jgi:hypothetical protein
MAFLQSDYKKIEELNATFEHAFESFKNKCLLMQQSSKQGKDFYDSFLQNLHKVNDIIVEYETFFAAEKKNFFDQTQKNEAQLLRDSEFIKNSKDYLDKADSELSKKRKHLETVKASMRTAIANINPTKITQIPVDGNPALKELFADLFVVLYKEPRNDFEWTKFKKAILKDKCDDFIGRAASLDPLEIPEEELKKLQEIKQAQALKDFVNADPKGEAVLDVIDYLEYIPESVKAEKDIRELEINYKSIKKDTITRKTKSEILITKNRILETNYKALFEFNEKITQYRPLVEQLIDEVSKKLQDLNDYTHKLTTDIQTQYERDIRAIPTHLHE